VTPASATIIDTAAPGRMLPCGSCLLASLPLPSDRGLDALQARAQVVEPLAKSRDDDQGHGRSEDARQPRWEGPSTAVLNGSEGRSVGSTAWSHFAKASAIGWMCRCRVTVRRSTSGAGFPGDASCDSHDASGIYGKSSLRRPRSRPFEDTARPRRSACAVGVRRATRGAAHRARRRAPTRKGPCSRADASHSGARSAWFRPWRASRRRAAARRAADSGASRVAPARRSGTRGDSSRGLRKWRPRSRARRCCPPRPRFPRRGNGCVHTARPRSCVRP
jgi:hypothetical protein